MNNMLWYMNQYYYFPQQGARSSFPIARAFFLLIYFYDGDGAICVLNAKTSSANRDAGHVIDEEACCGEKNGGAMYLYRN